MTRLLDSHFEGKVSLNVPNSVNILRWGESSCPRVERALRSFDLGKDCLIEQWDYARSEDTFVRTVVTSVEPERA